MKPAFPRKLGVSAPLLVDSYKIFHRLAYNHGNSTGVTEVLINFTGRSNSHTNIRGGSLGNTKNTHYMWAGLQAMINTIIVDVWGEFFKAPKIDALAAYTRTVEGLLGRKADTSAIGALHDLGYMPLEFRSLLEGVAVPYGVAAMTCRSTHPDFYWLPNYIETIISNEVWPVQTALTTSVAYLLRTKEYAAIDGTPEFLIPFLCHDFSLRGMMGGTLSSGGSLAGMGHLMSGFVGSDNLTAALRLERDYHAELSLEKAFQTIASVDATEHSVQCSFDNDDLKYLKHCLTVSPTGIVSVVSDGYDFWKMITEVVPQLHDDIMARDGKLVIRPDSGCPIKVVAGSVEVIDMSNCKELSIAIAEFAERLAEEEECETAHGERGSSEVKGFMSYNNVVYKVVVELDWNRHDKKFYYLDGYDVGSYEEYTLSAEEKGVVEVLWEQFGGTITDKGYKLLDSHIGVIYGDSITLERQKAIYDRLHAKGFAIGNCVLGLGSYTFQYVTRDTHGSAMKATNIVLDGIDTPIQKVVSGDAIKKSAKGRLVVKEVDGKLVQFDSQTLSEVDAKDNRLEVVWVDGQWERVQTLWGIREIVKQNIDKLYS